MARRNRELFEGTEAHDDLFFGSDDDALEDEHDASPPPQSARRGSARPGRSDSRHRSQERRKRRIVGIFALIVVLVVGATIYFVGVPAYRYLFPQDYDGNGSGQVTVTVLANDGSSQIGRTLEKAGVVGSERAFTDAASDDNRAQNIQPGSYLLRKHMSAKAALGLLLDPDSRIRSGTVVTEGATIVDVEQRLAAPPCVTNTATRASCGLGLSKDDITAALRDVTQLGIPTDYLPDGTQPQSIEGFLFPATYTFDAKTTAFEALQQMVGQFTDQVRASRFSAKAKALKLTPYDALKIASIAQGEAKFAADMPKVARVILNRLAVGRNLEVDATSAYAAKLRGLDPTKEIYAQTKGPFNSYNHAGLPPTPIGNPGKDAMTGAVNPAAGTWMYYVNKDAAGHLGFYTKEADFVKAAAKCKKNNWGCG